MSLKTALPGSALLATTLLLLHIGSVQADTLANGGGLAGLDSSAVAENELAGSRGRQGVAPAVQLADSNQTAAAMGEITIAEGSTLANGTNTLDGSAFSGSTGLISVIQNSGNQVVIQESNTVSIQYLPSVLQ